jgi:hypothetical protein
MGRPLSFAVTIAANGSAMIGHGYTELIGAKPGSRLTVTHQGDALILTRPGVPVPRFAPVEGAPTTYDSAAA